MRHFTPQDLVITNSSIPLHTDEFGTVYPTWSISGTYPVGKVVSRNGSLYQANTNIYPLATYSWNDIANGTTPITIRLADGVTMTPTAVPCVKDATVVYVIDTWKDTTNVAKGKYWIYTGTSGNVDFTTINVTSPANFTQILNYSNVKNEPLGDGTIFWKYLGRTNRLKVSDKSFNSQAIVHNVTEVWWEFDIKNSNKVVLFNLEAYSAKIICYTTDINNPFYENTIDSLLDTSSIVDWRTLSVYEKTYTKNADWTIPFFTGTIKCRVYLMSSSPTTLKLGEILYGQMQKQGVTLSKVPIQVKSSGKIVEKENGDVVLEDEGDITKVYTIFDFSLKFESMQLDYIIDQCTKIINKRLVVSAEDSDEPKYRSLVVYGFIRDASPSFDSSNTKSDIQIQLQRFN
jgi:hypothetical protein